MRRLPIVLFLAASLAGADTSQQKQPAAKAAPVSWDWYARGGWNASAFNRTVQVDQPGRTAFKTKGRFSVEVVPKGEQGEVLLRFFDSSGSPVAQVPGHVRGIGKVKAASAQPGGSMSYTWNKAQKWSDAGFDAASPFTTKALGDGSVRVELRSSKHPELLIEGTVPAAARSAR